MVAKHRVKRVRRTRKQSKHVRRGRKTHTRHNRRTGGTLYNPYTDTHDPESNDIDTTPPPLPPRSLELARKELDQVEGLNAAIPDPFWNPIIAELKAEIATFNQQAS